MGALLGLVAGVGLLLIWWAIAVPERPREHRGTAFGRRRTEMLADAGVGALSSAHLWLAQLAGGFIIGLLILLITRSVVIAAVFAIGGFALPVAVVRRLRAKRRSDLREVWPEAIDHLTSAVRAGLSIPEALSALSTRGPVALRPAFEAFGSDYRASGRFSDCLDALKARLADPIGDRVVETLRVTREVGGAELGTVLRTLSRFLREEGRVRAEIDSRKQATISGARLAVAAPWLVLLLLGSQSTTLAAYDTPAGLAILLAGAVVCVVAYRIMLRIGRLPDEDRVLR